MVRSSGTSETIENRGRLHSKGSSATQVVSTILDLIRQTSEAVPGRIHWIVQEEVSCLQKGHLSNERRLSQENRDWVAESEPQVERPGRVSSIGVRRWRDRRELSPKDMECSSETAITICLRRVAHWATQLPDRMHLEWVWNGRAISIVQADIAQPPAGHKPNVLVPKNIPSINVRDLSFFRSGTSTDFQTFRKLSNANLYRSLGYTMPPFFVLNDREVLRSILAGVVPAEVSHELNALTERPLIIRTDGTGIPTEKREMLPRSEGLHSAQDAESWLLNHFRKEVQKGELATAELCLIAHHFIPSVASAWARAEPGKRVVRIESLWGVPEGLYWYSHDTFEVDTGDSSITTANERYRLRERLRYKGTFIGPDYTGKWIPYQTARPHDWRRSVRKEEWLFEIARTTRLIAEQEKHEVSVMWFVDNHKEATSHPVLPWFHDKSTLGTSPKAAPRLKRAASRDFRIEKVSHWDTLQQEVNSGKSIERIVVHPVDSGLIRNADFANKLAKLAASQNIVVELSGGLLSHAYYILQREGAQVECIDLFGAEEEVVEYNKLVRDRIPAIIADHGERVETLRLDGPALLTALRHKLVEEGFEALDAQGGEELIGELADAQEVIFAICKAVGITHDELESEREDKRRRRGGFDRGFMLSTTVVPQSFPQESDQPEVGFVELRSQTDTDNVISDSASLPPSRSYRRPDLRYTGDRLVEKLIAIETELNKVKEDKQTFIFELPVGGQRQEFAVTLEWRRLGASLRSVVRIRVEPPQLPLKFTDDFQRTLNFPE
jgi:predicted house-cleaning noncanonical NTP pyrophosphatase (MazG superfamily)